MKHKCSIEKHDIDLTEIYMEMDNRGLKYLHLPFLFILYGSFDMRHSTLK